MDKYNNILYPIKKLWGKNIYRYVVEIKLPSSPGGRFYYYTLRKDPDKFVEEILKQHSYIELDILIKCNGTLILNKRHKNKM